MGEHAYRVNVARERELVEVEISLVIFVYTISIL